MPNETTVAAMAAKDGDLVAALNRLYSRRQVLGRVVAVAEAIERLQAGLQHAHLLGRPTRDISQRAMDAYSRLSTQLQIQPTPQIRMNLDRLNRNLERHFSAVVALVSQIEGNGEALHQAEVILNDFRRDAQTAVSLRIVLQQRGVPTQPTPLPMQQQLLREQIQQVAREEAACRIRIKGELVSMRDSADQVLQAAPASSEVYGLVNELRQKIDLDLRHLASGLPIGKMPIWIEIVEIGSDPWSVESASTADEAAAAKPAAPFIPQEYEVIEIPRSLWERLREWLLSPWRYRWSQIPRYRQEIRRRDPPSP
jgi:hypothetical protein